MVHLDFRPSNLNGNAPFLPTDQEIGIKPETIISDPNFNIGSHPGEIYINNSGTNARKTPPRRYDSQFTKYGTFIRPNQSFRPVKIDLIYVDF